MKFKLKYVKYNSKYAKFKLKLVNFKLKCVKFKFKICKFQIKKYLILYDKIKLIINTPVNTNWVWHTQVYEPTNQTIWNTLSGSEQTNKCVAVILFLIKCCML